MRPVGLEVADIFRQCGPVFRTEHAASLSRGQRRVMSAIEQCRTAALGGHVEVCDACGHQRIAYNSCSNRHCPKCQSLARAQWLQDRQAELLSGGCYAYKRWRDVNALMDGPHPGLDVDVLVKRKQRMDTEDVHQ